MIDLWNKFWKDSNGNIVIWQWPNIWLIAWAAFTFLSLIFTGLVSKIFTWGGEAGLLIWCLLEIFKGVNYFRRLLGLLILAYLVMNIARGLS